MKKTLTLLLSTLLFYSCSKPINYFRTGKIIASDYKDTIAIDPSNLYIVIPIEVNDNQRNLIFDTGADLVIFTPDRLPSKRHIYVRDSNGKSHSKDIQFLHSLNLGNQKIKNIFAVEMEFPEVFNCFGKGLLGNNVIKASDWLIENDKIVFSNHPFEIKSNFSLSFFYYGSNRLHTNFKINGCAIDTCLIDYGGIFDMELPISSFEKIKEHIQINSLNNELGSSMGLHGKETYSQTIVNCNIDLNGTRIDSININVKENSEKRVGLTFMKRFKQIAINNSTLKIEFGELKEKYIEPNNTRQKLYSFDLVNHRFIVDFVALNDSLCPELKIGDSFTEINSKKATEFSSYCEFLSWIWSIGQCEILELKNEENELITIKNLR